MLGIESHPVDGRSQCCAWVGKGKDGLVRIGVQVVEFYSGVGGRVIEGGRRIEIDEGRMEVGRSEVVLRASCDVWMSI